MKGSRGLALKTQCPFDQSFIKSRTKIHSYLLLAGLSCSRYQPVIFSGNFRHVGGKQIWRSLSTGKVSREFWVHNLRVGGQLNKFSFSIVKVCYTSHIISNLKTETIRKGLELTPQRISFCRRYGTSISKRQTLSA